MLTVIGLAGVVVGALGALVAHPAQDTSVESNAEQLAVLREINRELQTISEGMGTSLLPSPKSQAPVAEAQAELQIQPLISDLQQALAQLIAQTAQLQAAAASGGLVAEGGVAIAANEQTVNDTFAAMPKAGEYVPRELFGLSPAAAYRRFGTPSSVQAEGGAVFWRYHLKGGPRISSISLMFTDGYLARVSRSD